LKFHKNGFTHAQFTDFYDNNNLAKCEEICKKKVKDPNAIKKPLSAFMFFSMKEQKNIKAADPTLKMGDIIKKVSEIWKAMSEADKTPYNEEAAVSKREYEAKKKAAAATASNEVDQGKEEKDEGDGDDRSGSQGSQHSEADMEAETADD